VEGVETVPDGERHRIVAAMLAGGQRVEACVFVDGTADGNLSALAGEQASIELFNASDDWQDERALWGRIEVEHTP
jgi:hypothetical protein